MSGKRNLQNRGDRNHKVTEKKGAIETLTGRAVLEERSEFSGPLPPPEIFEKYEEICPGAADRILSMAENQSTHRQQIEKAFIFSRNKQSIAGTYIAGAIATSAIICGTVLLLNDKNIQGIVVIVTTAFTFFGTSVYGKRAARKQLSEKEDD
ncbi:DUF2335 domain-containing protein [Proteiniclasticum sp. BAD-10]|uniref:DUF2335 domain-containing protein n=1 Tax=Proteiniclasticum sediminis TaxID=2804028 RepID=A0A941CN76_9CLOT|nr:DUF2335 domain-containing protein [Proteiniclasticum sediminis]MBR0575670.1 DUF2335 domain-containing protein [Proteiniclasticum sediminis]